MEYDEPFVANSKPQIKKFLDKNYWFVVHLHTLITQNAYSAAKKNLLTTMWMFVSAVTIRLAKWMYGIDSGDHVFLEVEKLHLLLGSYLYSMFY